VIENAGIRAVGRSGSLELSADVWKFLGPAARIQAAQIMEDEKLLVQASFRAPMLAKIPFPPWALRKEEALPEGQNCTPNFAGGIGSRQSLTAEEI
jgi:hypothetical protein